MRPFHLLLLCVMLAVSACESLITDLPPDKLPTTESKLVVQSFISPQAARILVSVSESVPLFNQSGSTNGGTIKNAVVKISDGTNEAIILYETTSDLYELKKEDFPIVAGKTYTLSVSDGKRSATATCKIPVKQADVKSYAIDTVLSYNGLEQDTIITVKMTWQDIPVDTNFYRIRAYLDLEYSIPEGTTAETFQERRVVSRFNLRWDQTLGRNDFQSDANLDGATFNSPVGRATLPGVVVYDFGSGNRFTVYPKSRIVGITFEVDNTDADYYKYHRSLELSDNDNPFSEPALIYNNISGGLGCFAGYNTGQRIFTP